MTLMSEFKLTTGVVEAINDYFTAEELCDFLEIETRDFVARFEDEIVDRLEDILESIRWYTDDDTDEPLQHSGDDYDAMV